MTTTASATGAAAPTAARWLFAPLPVARVAWLRTLVYLFVPLDVLVTTPWVARHDTAPASLYRPLQLDRLLGLPAPTTVVVHVVEIALLAASLAAATGRLPRLLGSAVLVLYLEWMLIAFSWGKVDHDRFAFLVALAVLPTAGRATRHNLGTSEAAGFALRVTGLAVVATYLLSVVAKARFGGGVLHWLDSAVFVRAVLRRGTALGTPLLNHTWALHAGQYVLVALELASPLLLVLRGQALWLLIGGYVAFHLMTWASIGIVFLPHLVCLLALLPLERLSGGTRPLRWRQRAGGGAAGELAAVSGDSGVDAGGQPRQRRRQQQRTR